MTNEPNLSSVTTSPTAKRVFDRIDQESITPTPKMTLVMIEWGIWLLWLLTVLCGALALSVTSYVTMSAQYALYEATHENFVTFFVTIMPYMWLVLFMAMTYLAVREFRKTKRGYTYSTVFIILSNVACTILGAVILHYLGIGYAIDKQLGEQLSMYMSMEKMEQEMWQMPHEGRLVGMLDAVHTDEEKRTLIHFKDIHGVLWRLQVAELTDVERSLLSRQEPVRLLGTTTSEFSFHVCGVFPWRQGRALPFRDMRSQRQDFDRIMHEKMEKMKGRYTEDRADPTRIYAENELCTTLPIMGRMQPR